ncbi:MAG: hypothetical protein V7784_20825 [Oceanospirillaceae bacterium]
MSDLESSSQNSSIPSNIFFLLLILLVLPSSYFIFESYNKLDEILTTIEGRVNEGDIKLNNFDSKLIKSINNNEQEFKDLDLLTRVLLEHDVMMIRHERSKTAIATRTWLRFMSMLFGSILIVIGSGFVLGQVKAPKFEGRGESGGVKISLATSSPGLVLAFFGVCLMTIPNLNLASQTIGVDDSSSYVYSPKPRISEPSKDQILEKAKQAFEKEQSEGQH